jgi:hypothetical protein
MAGRDLHALGAIVKASEQLQHSALGEIPHPVSAVQPAEGLGHLAPFRVFDAEDVLPVS